MNQNKSSSTPELGSGLELFHSRFCSRSRLIRSVLEFYNVQREEREIEFGSKRNLKFSIYQELPILKLKERTIEDWRAILLYIDENITQERLLGSDPELRFTTFNQLEILDNKILPILCATQLLEPSCEKLNWKKTIEMSGNSSWYQTCRYLLRHQTAKRYLPHYKSAKIAERISAALKEASELLPKMSGDVKTIATKLLAELTSELPQPTATTS